MPPEKKTQSAWSPPATADFEKLGQFYIGRPFDLAAAAPLPGPLLYDSKDLVTHAVCVGMTGSGKTGLCVGLIEEAALDGVPTIAIDPKGDLPNLLLTFPGLSAAEFRPWVEEEEAARKGMDVDAYATQQAELWRTGLASWGQDGERIRKLKEAAEFTVYTPGSTAGIPLSILRSFAAPPPELREDAELFRERISTTVTSLLALAGVAADPLKSREHILLSTLLSAAWSEGRDVALADLVADVQEPPFDRVGAMELEVFYPPKERAELALRINALIAAPASAAWLEGEPLDIARLLRTDDGRPRVSIISIAHLPDAERMFVVSLVLNEVLAWVRSQPGTSSLRAIVYMDEIFGFFPPVAEPPSKRPMLTLLKQARAHGVGVVLATQNPVDLDYKGLANAGTWLIGRLQTERDKARVLEGLEGAAVAAGSSFDAGTMGESLAALRSRVFVMNNVHEDAPVVLESRWAMSYLRGPLTRAQIKKLMEGRTRPDAAAPPRQTSTAATAQVDQRARERRDAQIEKLRKTYAPKLQRAEEKLRNARQVIDREEEQARGAQVQTVVSVAATLLTAVLGRKRSSYATIGRGTTAARGAARALEQKQDVARAKEDAAAAERQLAELDAEFRAKLAELDATP